MLRGLFRPRASTLVGRAGSRSVIRATPGRFCCNRSAARLHPRRRARRRAPRPHPDRRGRAAYRRNQTRPRSARPYEPTHRPPASPQPCASQVEGRAAANARRSSRRRRFRWPTDSRRRQPARHRDAPRRRVGPSVSAGAFSSRSPAWKDRPAAAEEQSRQMSSTARSRPRKGTARSTISKFLVSQAISVAQRKLGGGHAPL